MMRIFPIAAYLALMIGIAPSAIAATQGPVRKAGGNTFPGVPSSVVAGIQQSPPKGTDAGRATDFQPLLMTFEAKPGAMIRASASRGYLTRVVTPFLHPVLKSTSSVKKSIAGQTIFLSIPPTQTEPVAIYIMDKDDNLDAVTLLLDPKDSGPVTIELKQAGMPGTSGPQFRFDDAKAARWEQSSPYTDKMTEMMREIAKGKVPPGYSFRAYSASDHMPGCQQAGLSVTPKQVLEGHDVVTFVGVLTDTTDAPIELQETSCAVQGVLAVASWPGPLLQPHQSSEIYIVVKRSMLGNSSELRPSALTGGAP